MADVTPRLRIRIVRALVSAFPGDVARSYRRNVLQLAMDLEDRHELRWSDVAGCVVGGLSLYPRVIFRAVLAGSMAVVASVAFVTLSPTPSTSTRTTYAAGPAIVAYSFRTVQSGVQRSTGVCYAVRGPTTIELFAVAHPSDHPRVFSMRGTCAPRRAEGARTKN